jgi:hypothetical protein
MQHKAAHNEHAGGVMQEADVEQATHAMQSSSNKVTQAAAVAM